MRLLNKVRLALGLPFKPEYRGDGLTLADVPRQGWWDRRPEPEPRCAVCGGRPTKFKRVPPWPGHTYAPTSYTCDAHESWLYGHSWSSASNSDTVRYIDNGPARTTCISCGQLSDECGCPQWAGPRATYRQQEARAVYGEA